MTKTLVLAFLVAATALGSSSTDHDRSFEGRSDDDSFHIGASRKAASGRESAGSAGAAEYVVESTDYCARAVFGLALGDLGDCLGEGLRNFVDCDSGEGMQFDPTDISRLNPDGTWSEPELNSVLACNAAASAVPIVVTEADFRSLPLTASSISVGPEGGWLPVNMVAAVYASSDAQVLPTTVLGQPVLVRATPTEFAWDFADGSTPLITTDPGAPFPDHTVSHTYGRAGDYVVTLTTTWSGEFSVDGGASYQPIDGTATTTSTAPSLSVTELRSQLVEDYVS